MVHRFVLLRQLAIEIPFFNLKCDDHPIKSLHGNICIISNLKFPYQNYLNKYLVMILIEFHPIEFFFGFIRSGFLYRGPRSASIWSGSSYQLRDPLVVFCHFFSKNFYIIWLSKTTHLIEFLDRRKINWKKWFESGHYFHFLIKTYN